MTGDKYIDILSEHLLPLLEDTGLKETFLFQQDNAPWHTSGAVNEFLVESERKVFDWPAYSPDVDIIENVWKYVKHYVREKSPTNFQAMIDFAFEAWNSDRLAEICSSLYDMLFTGLTKPSALSGPALIIRSRVPLFVILYFRCFHICDFIFSSDFRFCFELLHGCMLKHVRGSDLYRCVLYIF